MTTDPTATLLRTLAPSGRGAAVELVNELRRAGLPAIVTSARRSSAKQRQLIAAGQTTAARSRHLQGRALDIGFQGLRTEEVPAEWWAYAGSVWESFGGRWGGRFTKPDPLHFDW